VLPVVCAESQLLGVSGKQADVSVQQRQLLQLLLASEALVALLKPPWQHLHLLKCSTGRQQQLLSAAAAAHFSASVCLLRPSPPLPPRQQ
jgi:hypothetical protein